MLNTIQRAADKFADEIAKNMSYRDMIAEVYKAGAFFGYNQLTSWHDADKETPIKDGCYLVKVSYKMDGEPNEELLTAYWEGHWLDDHLDRFDSEDYEDATITHWREIYE